MTCFRMLTGLIQTKSLRLTVSICALLCIAVWAQAVVIDDFTTGAQSATAGNEVLDLSQTGLPTDHVLGGRRGVEFWGNNGISTLDIDTTNGGKAELEVAVTQDRGISGYLTLTYGTVDQPLNLNLAAIGHNAIRLRFRLTSIGTFLHLFPWYRVYGTGNQISFPVNYSASPDIIEVITPIPAENDLTDIDRISLEIFRVPDGTTLELLDIVTVPEPAALTLLGLGLIGLIRPRYHSSA